MDDKTIQDAVLRELDWEPKVDAAHIALSAKNSAVMPTEHDSSHSEKLEGVKVAEYGVGHVHSLYEEKVAENAAKAAYGVIEVDNEIMVTP